MTLLTRPGLFVAGSIFWLTAACIPRHVLAAAASDTVVVEVQNVHDGRGHVLVALCTAPSFLTMHCPYQASVPARAGTVVARIAGVLPGVYGVEAFHDYNDSKKLGRTFLGLPNKGLGFSRGAKPRYGPPRFADAAFAVDQPEVKVSVVLRYY